MTFVAIVESAFEEGLEFDEIITNEDNVVSLSNAGNMDLTRTSSCS